MAHTPGPWTIEREGWNGQFIYGNDSRTNGKRFIADVSLYWDGAEANARLIAAAPELLEALMEILEVAKASLQYADSIPDEDRATINKAKAAIAKAEGVK